MRTGRMGSDCVVRKSESSDDDGLIVNEGDSEGVRGWGEL